MKRRDLLAASGAVLAAAALPRPAIGQSAGKTLKFIPEGNLQNPDPIWSTTTVARNFGYMIWDTLYGWGSDLTSKPQMCEGHEVSADGLTWRFRLREGLKFHDGSPVRAADCVASMQRWMKRDGFAQRIEAATSAIDVASDRDFVMHLKKPFPLLAHGLGKPTANVCFIMPERIARTDPYKQIDEYIGSGPYVFNRNEWSPGALASFKRFDGYVPRQEPPNFVAGGKQANFERIEWNIITDPATSSAAIQAGEQDWWQTPTVDLLPTLRKANGVVVERLDDYGVVGVMRFNMLHPPFDNVKLRRAILPALNQADFMNAVMGGDPELTRINVGVFTPGSPLANTAGLETLTRARDLALAKKLVAESGYNGEKIVFISPGDYPVLNAECLVGADLLGKLGINVDLQSMDWGTMIQRRNIKDTNEKGGWNAFCTGWEGLNLVDPGAHYPIAGNGEKGWFGWFSSQKMEDLRTAWFDAPDLATQKQVAEQIQLDVWQEAPYYPLGQWLQPIAHRTTIDGIVKSPFPLFWSAKKSA
jgi:peptide/nickel transport system substrate-binding protein